MKIKLLMLAMALAGSAGVQAAASGGAHWEYTGKAGATHWGELEKGFATCKMGKQQSPIDIRRTHRDHGAPIDFGYTTSAAEIVNNGHTVEVDLADGGTLHLSSGDYHLVQFHFHTPSEETINGKHYPLVAHLVHKNGAGELAVVAVLFKQGRDNPALKRIFAELPAAAGDKHPLEGGFNVDALLPAQRSYYAYMGSLTTPPCSEGVHWQILKQPVDISRAQLSAFRKLYPMNARPVQRLNGRVVEVID